MAAVVSVPLFALGGCIAGTCIGFFSTANKDGEEKQKASSGTGLCHTITYVGLSTLVGMAGWAVENAGGAETVMSLGKTAAAFATGSAITMIPAGLALVCVVTPLAFGAVACMRVCTEDKENAEAEKAAPPPAQRLSV